MSKATLDHKKKATSTSLSSTKNTKIYKNTPNHRRSNSRLHTREKDVVRVLCPLDQNWRQSRRHLGLPLQTRRGWPNLFIGSWRSHNTYRRYICATCHRRFLQLWYFHQSPSLRPSVQERRWDRRCRRLLRNLQQRCLQIPTGDWEKRFEQWKKNDQANIEAAKWIWVNNLNERDKNPDENPDDSRAEWLRIIEEWKEKFEAKTPEQRRQHQQFHVTDEEDNDSERHTGNADARRDSEIVTHSRGRRR